MSNSFTVSSQSRGVTFKGGIRKLGWTSPIRHGRRAARTWSPVEFLEQRQLLTIGASGFWEGDDTSPALSVTVSDAVGWEHAGFADVVIGLDGTIGDRSVTVRYRTVEGTAVANEDYYPQEGSVVLDAANPARTVRVGLVNDGLPEGPDAEYFYLEIVDTGSAAKVDDRGLIKILDDDFGNWPRLILNPVSIEEGDSGTRPLDFRLRLSSPAVETIVIPYWTENGIAKAGEDYLSQTGSVTFAPGEREQTVTIQIVGDTLAEMDENFRLVLDPTTPGVRIDPWSGWATINNDDPFHVPDFELAKFSSEAELNQWLLDRAVEQYKYLFGTKTNWPWGWWRWDWFDVLAGAPPEGSGNRTPSHSETNVQEAGVDEGDIMETDGDFIYVISQNELLIFDALPADALHLVSRTLLREWPHEMYLDGDRLTIVSSGFNYAPGPWLGRPVLDLVRPIWWPGGSARSTVTVFDVSNRERPAIVQKVELDGSVQSSRMIEGQLYLVTQNSIEFPRPLLYEVDPESGQPKPDPVDQRAIVWDGTKLYQYESESHYRVRLQETIAKEVLPKYSSRGADPDDPSKITGLVSKATDIFRPLLPDEQSLVSVVTVNTRSDGPQEVHATSIFSSYAATTYVSTSNIYLVTPYYPRWDIAGWAGEWSSVLKFKLSEEGTELVAAGGVRGRVLNQFSLGEHKEHLRIATTESWGPRARNNVYILGQEGNDLVVKGAIEDLARGETIFSARFLGDRGYVVTFRRIDPLFTLDLSDATNPLVVAELKLPGFSEYLQPLSKSFLLGIGRDADPVTGISRGVQVTLFNVAEAANPFVAAQYTFTDAAWWSWTPAAYEHHAVGYYPEYDTLAMPITSGAFEVPVDWDNDGKIDYTYVQPRSALWVFNVDLDASPPELDVRGTVMHESEMRRSVRVNDHLYAISYGAISSHPIANPGQTLAAVAFMQDWVGIQVDPENSSGDNLLILGSTGREVVALEPTTGGRFLVRVNGSARGEYDQVAVAQVLADGVAGPDKLLLSARSKLPENIRAANLTPRLTGDLDGNGAVDFGDFARLKGRFGEAVDDALMDIDGDGVYGLAEFNTLKANFGVRASEALRTATSELQFGVPKLAVLADAALAEA